MKAQRSTHALSPKDLEVRELPHPEPDTQIRGAGQDLFRIFRTDLLERFLGPAQQGEGGAP